MPLNMVYKYVAYEIKMNSLVLLSSNLPICRVSSIDQINHRAAIVIGR